jgi:hypothetical protein
MPRGQITIDIFQTQWESFKFIYWHVGAGVRGKLRIAAG